MANLLLTDLDNTLIFSHRHITAEPFYWVEKYNGNNQSYMTKKTYEFFKNQRWLEVVPITTRTQQQYERLRELFVDLGWDRVLICNGAILMENGMEDRAWTKESIEISKNERPELERILDLATVAFDESSIVSNDPFMFYIKTIETERCFAYIKEQADLSQVSVLRDTRKVYVFPKSLDKSCAAARCRKANHVDRLLAAGDSEFDRELLTRADICFCPQNMKNIKAVGRKIVCQGILSDRICSELEIMGENHD